MTSFFFTYRLPQIVTLVALKVTYCSSCAVIIGSYMVLNVTYRYVQILESLIIFNNHNNNHNNSKFTDLASEPTCSLYNSNGSAKTLRNGLWGVSK